MAPDGMPPSNAVVDASSGADASASKKGHPSPGGTQRHGPMGGQHSPSPGGQNPAPELLLDELVLSSSDESKSKGPLLEPTKPLLPNPLLDPNPLLEANPLLEVNAPLDDVEPLEKPTPLPEVDPLPDVEPPLDMNPLLEPATPGPPSSRPTSSSLVRPPQPAPRTDPARPMATIPANERKPPSIAMPIFTP